MGGGDDFRLPHPEYGVAVFLVLHRAVQRAFELMHANGDIELGVLEEDDITIHLQKTLLDEILEQGHVPGFDRDTYAHIGRQHRCINYNGERVKNEPDMLFVIRDDERNYVRRSEDGIVTECKPVDSDHAPGHHYCTNGIRRFVAGDYAWAMPEALMIGYIRGSRTIAKTLVPAMRRNPQSTNLATVSEPSASEKIEDHREALHSSRHRRDFTWMDDHGPATPITLYHSWHNCE